jgi:hypothetical protein
MEGSTFYAAPRHVDDLTCCYFYHTTDVPGHGVQRGEWDLRPGVDAYLGGVDLRGQRVLEIGTASGFLCFAMEQRGAEVVAFDLPATQPPDLIPFARADLHTWRANTRTHLDKLHNAYWLCHRLLGSRARVVYGSAYAIPDAIGPVDVCTFGCVLLHLRDPFLALEQALRLTRDTVIVTELLASRSWWKRWLRRRLTGPALRFLPDSRRAAPPTSWWQFSPEAIQAMLGVCGFERTTVTIHRQLFQGRPVDLFTVVGRRTCGQPVVSSTISFGPTRPG